MAAGFSNSERANIERVLHKGHSLFIDGHVVWLSLFIRSELTHNQGEETYFFFSLGEGIQFFIL